MPETSTYKHPDWAKAIRERDGRRCVKCDYHHASPHAIGDGYMLCDACVKEWEALHDYGRGRFQITVAEWLKLPSLIQFIQIHRIDHKQGK